MASKHVSTLRSANPIHNSWTQALWWRRETRCLKGFPGKYVPPWNRREPPSPPPPPLKKKQPRGTWTFIYIYLGTREGWGRFHARFDEDLWLVWLIYIRSADRLYTLHNRQCAVRFFFSLSLSVQYWGPISADSKDVISISRGISIHISQAPTFASFKL